MRALDLIIRFITNKEIRWSYLVKIGWFNRMDDRKYIEKKFVRQLGYKPDLDNPKTLNEKLNWIKLYDRNPYYTQCVDKYEIKQIVAQKIGEEHVTPLLGVWNSFAEIDFDSLPNQFVLKCTHDGGPIVCKDKNKFNKKEAEKIIKKKLRNDYYAFSREWPYKNVNRRIIAEQYMPSLGNRDSTEYKLTCCNGVVKMITVCTGIAHSSFEDRNNDHFDRDWNKLSFYAFYKSSGKEIKRPEKMDQMIEYAEKLAEGIPYVRVDFYICDGKIIFGEMTFFTWGGWIIFTPPKWDKIMGEWVNLPDINN